MQALTRVLSRECARRSIRVNAVAPGLIDTAMAATIPETGPRTDASRDPLAAARDGPRRSPSAVLFLCSPLAVVRHRATLEGRRRLERLTRAPDWITRGLDRIANVPELYLMDDRLIPPSGDPDEPRIADAAALFRDTPVPPSQSPAGPAAASAGGHYEVEDLPELLPDDRPG